MIVILVIGMVVDIAFNAVDRGLRQPARPDRRVVRQRMAPCM